MTAARLVVDASIAVKCVLYEVGSEAARDYLYNAPDLAAPPLMLVEAANAICKRERMGLLGPGAAREAWAELIALPVSIVGAEAELAEDAFELGLRLRHPVQDCLYLALALHNGARVLTADARFARATRDAPGLHDAVILLGN